MYVKIESTPYRHLDESPPLSQTLEELRDGRICRQVNILTDTPDIIREALSD